MGPEDEEVQAQAEEATTAPQPEETAEESAGAGSTEGE